MPAFANSSVGKALIIFGNTFGNATNAPAITAKPTTVLAKVLPPLPDFFSFGAFGGVSGFAYLPGLSNGLIVAACSAPRNLTPEIA